MDVFTVYILRTNKNTLYTGQTKNLNKRLFDHANKKGAGAKYLKQFSAFHLVYREEFQTRSEALKREYQIKQMSKLQKELLISSFQSK